MFVPEKESRSQKPAPLRPKPPAPASLKIGRNLASEYVFVDHWVAMSKNEKNATSVFSLILDQIFVFSLAWTKVCVIALTTDASLVRIMNFSHLDTISILICIYGISWFNYHLIFMALKRPTLGQSLHR